jgi:hypothetical protein
VTFGFATGIGSGAGIVTGMQTGACLAVEADREKCLITPEEVNEVLSAAGTLVASGEDGAEGPVAAGDMACEKVDCRSESRGRQGQLGSLCGNIRVPADFNDPERFSLGEALVETQSDSARTLLQIFRRGKV